MAAGKNIKPFTFPDFDRIGTDEDGKICLDRKPIEVKKMTLTRWQAIIGASAAIIGSLSAATIAILQIMDRV